MMLSRLGLALATILLCPIAAMAAEDVAEPDGYRMEAYRAPVPDTLEGARVIDTGEAEGLWRQENALFVDVLPRPVKPDNLPEDTVWSEPVRHDIPGSIWLPNVGYGALPPELEDYFRTALEEATAGSKWRPLVIYCLDNCWMSWNAAKRALELGYERVIWFPKGTDGWSSKGLPLEEREPMRLRE